MGNNCNTAQANNNELKFGTQFELPIQHLLHYSYEARDQVEPLPSHVDEHEVSLMFFGQPRTKDLQLLKELASKGKMFSDSEFRLKEHLKREHQIGRVGSLYPRSTVIESQIRPEQVVLDSEGTVSSLKTYYLATMMRGLAYHPEVLKDVFLTKNNKLGYHLLRLCLNGEFCEVPIDDKIVINSQTKQPTYAKPQGKNIWPLLLQKAWVKITNGFGSNKQQPPIYPLQEITGCRVLTLKLQESLERVRRDCSRALVFVAAKQKIEQEIGIYPTQLMLVSRTEQITYSQNHQQVNTFLYKLEFPVKCQVKSRFLTDKEFNSQVCRLFGIEKHNQHTVYLTEQELLRYFSSLYVGQIGVRKPQQRIKVSGKLNYFIVTVNRPTELTVRLVQYYQRYVKGSGYSYSDADFELIDADSAKSLIVGPQDYGSFKTSHLSKNGISLHKGTYLLRVRVVWRSEKLVSSCIAILQSDQRVEVAPAQEERGNRLLKAMLLVKALNSQGEQLRHVEHFDYKLEWLQTKGFFYIKNLRKSAKSFKVKFERCVNVVFEGQSEPRAELVREMKLEGQQESVVFFEQHRFDQKAEIGNFALIISQI